MMVEEILFGLLKPLVASRVFPDTAPFGVARPFIIYQQVGGKVAYFLDNTPADKRNATMQITIWADTRKKASALASQVEETLTLAQEIVASPYGAPHADYEPTMRWYSSMQDFSIWSDR
jgi:hypothetical protein